MILSSFVNSSRDSRFKFGLLLVQLQNHVHTLTHAGKDNLQHFFFHPKILAPFIVLTPKFFNSHVPDHQALSKTVVVVNENNFLI